MFGLKKRKKKEVIERHAAMYGFYYGQIKETMIEKGIYDEHMKVSMQMLWDMYINEVSS